MTLDTRALNGPIDRRELRAFRRTLPTSVRPGLSSVVLPIAVILLFPALLIFFDGSSAFGDGPRSLDLRELSVPFLLMPLVGVVLLVRVLWRRNGTRQFRIASFARANSFTYTVREEGPGLPGMIFARDNQTSAFATDLVRREVSPSFVVANHRLATGSGKNRREYRWGYVALELNTPLPHIVLDAQRNNSWGKSSLPHALASGQRLSLEGDFDRYFALYCPEGYEADALYLFTPDVMARLIDTSALFDIEIIDDYLFLYSRDEVSTIDPARWQQVLAAIEVVTHRLAQWERWRDDRIKVAAPAKGQGNAVPYSSRRPGVANQGQRLRRRSKLWQVVLIIPVIIVLYALFSTMFP